MKTLREYIDEADEELKGLNDISVEHLVGRVKGNNVIITAIMDLTAVVHPPGKEHDKVVVNLNVVSVLKDAIKWVPKSQDQQRIFRSGSRGRKKFLNLAEFAKQKAAEAAKKVAM